VPFTLVPRRRTSWLHRSRTLPWQPGRRIYCTPDDRAR
jgi:hypothetical protein